MMAVAVGIGCFTLCQKIVIRQNKSPITNRGERAIWRLAYRQGWELSLDQILAETMLEENAALTALHELETKGQAVLIAPKTWKLQS